ncbi:hypothetical protein RF11_02125 [Thelohanellus kitauei]|uniref:Uncharacterized protein n=1 Tax=Thelohanellus kitauei TaxID=669202 RepID=A0A0C2N966_THEKT|nr:hypothetical protein RF11_02125 [Thelohanellus kitauei]
MYINKLQEKQKLSLFEDAQNNLLCILDENLINNIFSWPESEIFNHVFSEISENTEDDKYKKYKQIMADVILSFNESNYLGKDKANHYTELCNLHSHNLSPIKSIPDNSGTIVASNTSPPSTLLHNLPFLGLLRYFILIFELKFIFGDIDSKLENLNLSSSL